MTITPRLRLATGALALTVVLAGCGDSTEPAGGGTTAASTTDGEQAAQEHNEADTMFAQMMIVHHEGAIEMAQLAQEKAVTSEVQELADTVLCNTVIEDVVGVRVQDEAGAPIAQAQLHLVGTAFAAVTDPRGRYFINNIPAGTWSVS